MLATDRAANAGGDAEFKTSRQYEGQHSIPLNACERAICEISPSVFNRDLLIGAWMRGGVAYTPKFVQERRSSRVNFLFRPKFSDKRGRAAPLPAR